MSPISGQTAGPNGLNFFVDTRGFLQGVFTAEKNRVFFVFKKKFKLKKKKIYGQRKALQLVYHIFDHIRVSFKGTVVKKILPSLLGGLLEITLYLQSPLKKYFYI